MPISAFLQTLVKSAEHVPSSAEVESGGVVFRPLRLDAPTIALFVHCHSNKNMKVEAISPAVSAAIECDGWVPVAIRFDGYDGPTYTAPTCWRTGVFKQTIVEVANPSSGAIWKIVLASLRPIRSQPIISAIPADKT